MLIKTIFFLFEKRNNNTNSSNRINKNLNDNYSNNSISKNNINNNNLNQNKNKSQNNTNNNNLSQKISGDNTYNKNKSRKKDISENEITILAYEKDESFLKYSNCGTNINNKVNNDIIETLIGIKSQLENIINSNNSINIMKSQIKNINLILDNSIKEIKKNNNKLQISNNNEIENKIKIIEGIINIEKNVIDLIDHLG